MCLRPFTYRYLPNFAFLQILREPFTVTIDYILQPLNSLCIESFYHEAPLGCMDVLVNGCENRWDFEKVVIYSVKVGLLGVGCGTINIVNGNGTVESQSIWSYSYNRSFVKCESMIPYREKKL